MDTNETTLSQNAKKRIFADTKDILKNPLTEMGIYYKNDEQDLSVGYALIIGPNDTLYQYGYYLFKFKYPHNYPFEPPKVTFLTNDGKTRFNPNLYRNGKVCLSLLNTWEGPLWKPCQTLRSVLLSILTNVFVKDPLCNEPGFTTSAPDNIPYNEVIRYKNIDFACLSLYTKKAIIDEKAYSIFYPTIQAHFQENYEDICKYVFESNEVFAIRKHDLIKNNWIYNDNIIRMPIYRMDIDVQYNCLIDKITSITPLNI